MKITCCTGAMVVSICFASTSASAQDSNYFTATIDAIQPKMVKVFGAGVGRVESYATGILVSDEGHVLTAQGSILDGRQVRVLLADGTAHSASVLRRDRERQLALLQIDAKTPDHFELSPTPVGQKGDWVIAISNAFRVADKDEPVSAMMGILSLRTSMEARLNSRDIAYKGELVLIDAITSNPGAGGGAVVTADGQLVGMVGKIINSSKTNTRLNYAVPAHVLLDFFENKSSQPSTKIMDTQTKPKTAGNIGIRIFRLGGKRDPAYIDRVKSSSLAAKAGLKADDLIVSIGGEKVGNVRQYDRVMKTLKPEEEMFIVVKRGAKLKRFAITPVAADSTVAEGGTK